MSDLRNNDEVAEGNDLVKDQVPDDNLDLRAIGEVPATIFTEPGPIPVKDFGEFFTLFRTAYAATVHSLDASGELGSREALGSTDRVVRLASAYLQTLTQADIDLLAARPLEVEPSILSIHRENQIELVICGLLVAFGGAVILSGGEFSLKVPTGFHVKLPPLGQGIQNLRAALRRG